VVVGLRGTFAGLRWTGIRGGGGGLGGLESVRFKRVERVGAGEKVVVDIEGIGGGGHGGL